MNIVKVLEEIIKVKEELSRVKRDLEYQSRVLDEQVYNIIEFLKSKRIIESRIVK